MNRSALALLLVLLLAGAAPSSLRADEEPAASGPEPVRLGLMDAIKTAFKNNKDIRVDSYVPEFRQNDIMFQKAVFDAAVTTTTGYEDASRPSFNVFDIQATGTVAGVDSTQWFLESRYDDRLRIGSNWSATLLLARSTSTSANAVFPESYFSQLEFAYTQSFLKNFGRRPNETEILIASNNLERDKETFRARVLSTLLEVEDAYWTLVFTRQDLEVKKEALKLAQELLKLNQIKVQVGTLAPIDITQAEAGVASREEAVIVAEAAIQAAEDRVRRVMGMDPQGAEWRTPILPSEELTIATREAILDDSIRVALEERTDLAAARLDLKNADADLSRRRNQLRYTLDGTARYTLQGLAGDTPGDPVLGLPARNDALTDAWEFIPKRDFPTYNVSVTFGIPIGNRSEEAQYTNARLRKEQSSISYQSLEQQAIVEVADAVRRVNTDRKRIQAAEKNRVLQERKVEAEQKKFENGMSTSFEVLTFQNDLAAARSAENRARTDYRISLANLDTVTGVLDKTLNVKVEGYARD